MKMRSLFCLPEGYFRKEQLWLTVFFILGHLLGVCVSGYASDSFLSAMRTVVGSRVSIIGLLSSLGLPLLTSAVVVYLSRPVLLFPIAFWKAFMFSYIGSCVFTAWGSAGWLITPLAMCSSLCGLPVLYWYWMRHISGGCFRCETFAVSLTVLTVVGIVDLYLVGPFLARIIIF